MMLSMKINKLNACHLSFRSHIARKEIKYKTHDAIHEDQQTECLSFKFQITYSKERDQVENP